MSRIASFGQSLKPPVDILDFSPTLVCVFLFLEEENGNVQYHDEGCPHLGQPIPGKGMVRHCATCPVPGDCRHTSTHWDNTWCPIRIRPETLKVIINHLVMGFRTRGLTAEWLSATGRPNPADSLEVRQHLTLVSYEDRMGLEAPVQIVPIGQSDIMTILTTLQLLISHSYKTRAGHSPLRPLQLLLDYFFILTVHLTGHRLEDVARIRPQTVLWLPDKNGLRLALHVHKTTDSIASAQFIDIPSDPSNPTLCILRAHAVMVQEAYFMGWDLRRSRFLFPKFAVDDDASVLRLRDFETTDSINTRFVFYVSQTGRPEGMRLQGCGATGLTQETIQKRRILSLASMAKQSVALHKVATPMQAANERQGPALSTREIQSLLTRWSRAGKSMCCFEPLDIDE
ncbi:hypothetical protein BJ741DRAFT_240961 [Chytriomyces cf. hyalinus JEL632]|nr:hypothetical protein BJ741DRAFT_240961 [Chytriomyces cf. hyalinus JEL632]